MRLFAAVRPPDVVLDHVDMALNSVRGGVADPRSGVRWTAADARHVTLAFYGEVPQGYVEELSVALDGIAQATAPFDASLRGAGLFDGRTLWIGCSGVGWGPLMSAATQVGTGLLGRAEDRRSRAHLTVARMGGRRGRHSGGTDPAAYAHALALYTGPSWTVGEIVLVCSTLGAGVGGSPAHDIVHRSELQAVAR